MFGNFVLFIAILITNLAFAGYEDPLHFSKLDL